MLSTRYLINAFGGYVDTWYEKDGKLVFSAIQPELKEALTKLNALYEEGLMDREFGTKSESNIFEDAVSGKCGVVFGNFTAPFPLDNGVRLGQEWGFFPLYAEDGTLAKCEQSIGAGSCVAVSADCKNPEAVIKLFNLCAKYTSEQGEIYASNGINNIFNPTVVSLTGVNNRIYEQYMEQLATGKAPEVPVAGYQSTVDQAESYRVDGNPDGWIMWAIFGENSTETLISNALANDGYLISENLSPAGDAAIKYGGNLGTMRDQMITYIINGTKEPDYFDEFVDAWLNNGGSELVEEVNEWYLSK